MKASNPFETAIKTYVEAEVKSDPDLAKAIQNKAKNLTDCCSYIMGEVKKLGVSAMTDNEVFSLAKKYYLAENLEKIKPVKGHVVVGGNKETVEEINKNAPKKPVVEKSTATKEKPAIKAKKAKEEKSVDGTQLSLFELMQ